MIFFDFKPLKKRLIVIRIFFFDKLRARLDDDISLNKDYNMKQYVLILVITLFVYSLLALFGINISLQSYLPFFQKHAKFDPSKYTYRFSQVKDQDCELSIKQHSIRQQENSYQYDCHNTYQMCTTLSIIKNTDISTNNSNTQQSQIYEFKSSTFLSLLRNKNISIIGDSLGLQLYVGLITSLALEPHVFKKGQRDMCVYMYISVYMHIIYSIIILWY